MVCDFMITNGKRIQKWLAQPLAAREVATIFLETVAAFGLCGGVSWQYSVFARCCGG
jgi:hypothetical protein